MASTRTIRLSRAAGLLLLFGSGPGFVWSCSDGHTTIPRSPPPQVEPQEKRPVKRVAPPSPERENVQRKLDDLSKQIEELKATIRAKDDAGSQ